MKAAVYRTYGPPDVVRVEDVPTPQPKDHEVLIRISASTVSSADWRVRSLQLPRGFGLFARPVFGLFGPRQPILGTELAGTIEAVGRAVTRFQVGEAVFPFPGPSWDVTPSTAPCRRTDGSRECRRASRSRKLQAAHRPPVSP